MLRINRSLFLSPKLVTIGYVYYFALKRVQLFLLCCWSRLSDRVFFPPHFEMTFGQVLSRNKYLRGMSKIIWKYKIFYSLFVEKQHYRKLSEVLFLIIKHRHCVWGSSKWGRSKLDKVPYSGALFCT